MDSFRWIAVVLSMILGLGVTRLLSSAVEVFRSRHQAKMDWVPFVWAGCIFIWQLQFWWGIIELPSLVKAWSVGSFLVLVSLTLLLFVSAGLVLHTDVDSDLFRDVLLRVIGSHPGIFSGRISCMSPRRQTAMDCYSLRNNLDQGTNSAFWESCW
jgi:hypothetical protein